MLTMRPKCPALPGRGFGQEEKSLIVRGRYLAIFPISKPKTRNLPTLTSGCLVTSASHPPRGGVSGRRKRTQRGLYGLPKKRRKASRKG